MQVTVTVTLHNVTLHRHVTSRCCRHVTSRHVTSRHITLRHVPLPGSRFEVPLYIASHYVTSRPFTRFKVRGTTLHHVTLRHVTSRYQVPVSRYLLVAVADPLDHFQVSPDLLEKAACLHMLFKSSLTTVNLRNVPHDFIQVGSRHS